MINPSKLTHQLEVQLDSAKTKNIARLKFIQTITEVDTDINYKNINTIGYIKLLTFDFKQ